MRAKNGTSQQYSAIHQWLIYHYGNPLKCDDCGIIGKKLGQKWSIEHALKPNFKYEKNIDNFTSLCMKCHRNMDLNDEMFVNFRKGWIERRKKFGLNKIDPKTGRFIKNK